MVQAPLRCATCGHTDFYVISCGVAYANGAMVEAYRWPERRDELDDEGQLEEVIEAGQAHDGGYQVEQEILREPDIDSIDGPVKALCAGCLMDITEAYVQMGRSESLPV